MIVVIFIINHKWNLCICQKNTNRFLVSSFEIVQQKSEMSTLVELFRRATSQAELKSRIVVHDGDTKWTLAELDTMSEKLAKHFVEKYGAKRGDCIGIYMNKCASYALAYTAILKAGQLLRSLKFGSVTKRFFLF